MFTDAQLKEMLSLQDKMNSKIDIDWRDNNNDWLLAAAMETSEAIDHHGWKWWKHQEPDIAQLQMELVDIWHFILSYILQKQVNTLCNIMCYSNTIDNLKHKSLIQNLKLFAAYCYTDRLRIHLFFQICKQANLPLEELYKQYVGKNILNIFRQDNGYKQGTYIKIWPNNKEDNVYLVDILNKLPLNTLNYSEKLYQELQAVYDKTTTRNK